MAPVAACGHCPVWPPQRGLLGAEARPVCVVAWGPSVGAVRGAFGCGFGQAVVSVSAEVTAASKVAQEPLALPCALGDLSHPSPGTHLPLGARGLQIWGNQAAPEPGRTLSRPRRALDPGTCHPRRGQSCPRCVLGWPGQSSAGGQGAGPEGPSSPPAGASQASYLVSRQEHRPSPSARRGRQGQRPGLGPVVSHAPSGPSSAPEGLLSLGLPGEWLWVRILFEQWTSCAWGWGCQEGLGLGSLGQDWS